VPRQLSDGDHVGRLLELDGLGIDEFAFIVDDDPRVEAAVVGAVDVGALEYGRELGLLED
jgi:hypothetical protein